MPREGLIEEAYVLRVWTWALCGGYQGGIRVRENRPPPRCHLSLSYQPYPIHLIFDKDSDRPATERPAEATNSPLRRRQEFPKPNPPPPPSSKIPVMKRRRTIKSWNVMLLT